MNSSIPKSIRYHQTTDPIGASLYTIIHAPYWATMINKDTKSLFTSVNKIISLCRTDCAYVVIHFGSETSTSRNPILAISDFCSRAIPQCKGKLLMENSAAQGGQYGCNIGQLCAVKHKFNDIGFCLDTQHAFAAGMIDFRSGWEGKLDTLHRRIGIDLLHLNDSKVPFGSKVDRHENLREGFIWGDGREGELERLLDFCFEREIAVVCETPNCLNDMKYVCEYMMAKVKGQEENLNDLDV